MKSPFRSDKSSSVSFNRVDIAFKVQIARLKSAVARRLVGEKSGLSGLLLITSE
jgi:hypothetical protein